MNAIRIGDIILYRDAAGGVSPGIVNALNRDKTIDLMLFPARSSAYCVTNVNEIDSSEFTGWFRRLDSDR